MSDEPVYSVILELPDEHEAGFMVEKIREVAYPRLLVEFELSALRHIDDLNQELRSRGCPTIPYPEGVVCPTCSQFVGNAKA